MPISGAVVIVSDLQEKQSLASELAAEDGVEVSGIGPAGIAIIVETKTMDEMTCLTSKIKHRSDVKDLEVTYCNWEDLDG